MNIESTKLEIIKIILELQDEVLVKKLLLFLSSLDEKDTLATAKIPTPESIDLEMLKKLLGYDIEKMNKHYASIDRSIWKDENIKELMEAI